MLCYAAGEPIEMGGIQKSFGFQLTSVQVYIQGLTATAGGWFALECKQIRRMDCSIRRIYSSNWILGMTRSNYFTFLWPLLGSRYYNLFHRQDIKYHAGLVP
jgi:hypothetical protein